MRHTYEGSYKHVYSSFKEQLWIQLNLENNDVLLAGCMYRSPSGDRHKSVGDLASLLRNVIFQSHSPAYRGGF